MAEQKNPQAQPELSLSEQTRIRREKLTNLQAEGQNPFVITRFDWDATSQQIKDNFDAMEGKPVKVAGRLMSKRGMGKVSFCDLQDRDGRIQLYARQDEMDEEVYKKFKKFDIGDIVGVEGEAFRTQRGEMSVRAHNITLLSKSLLPLPRLLLPPEVEARLPEGLDRGQLLSVLWRTGALRPGQVSVQLGETENKGAVPEIRAFCP